MIRINQLKCHPSHTEEALRQKVLQLLGIRAEDLLSFDIQKQSIDARKKPEVFFVYTVDVMIQKEASVWKRVSRKHKNVQLVQPVVYRFPKSGSVPLPYRPVIAGTGPAGLFCGYMLAKAGYRPILIERGAPVEERQQDVQNFWNTGILNPDSNVQFGEGGAGTFSDGKLNTLVKDPNGRNKKVLELFVEHGAPASILYEQKPHVGTDVLVHVIKNIRNSILQAGGAVYFHVQVEDLDLDGQTLRGLYLKKLTETAIFPPEARDIQKRTAAPNDTAPTAYLPCTLFVPAIGHSARDTFAMFHRRHLPMEAKSFAVGVRIEHPQQMINESQYGINASTQLPTAAYKLTAQLESGRGVYTFCMCPGGYVVNASSEEQHLAVNGMSYHDRASANANSAVIVTVTPEDYGDKNDPLSGVSFQRQLEKRAYEAGQGKIPVQCFDDFFNDQISTEFGEVTPCIKGQYTFGDVRGIFPPELSCAIAEGITAFDRKIHGFSRKDAILSGVESRTSSPVKILRNENLQSAVSGIFPCGEGAGYAGGITSAAMDGLKIAEKIAENHRSFD